MNFYNMKCFLELAKQMNFHRAAEKLYVSEQALSGMVNRMEKECGAMLLERTPKVKLTSAGEVFARKAHEILELMSDMTDEIKDIASEESGILRIGITRARANILLPETVPEFLQSHPRVSLEFITDSSSVLHEKLLNDELNLAISASSATPSGIVQERLMSEHVCAVIPKEIYHRQYPELQEQETARGMPLDFARFAQERFLLPPAGLLHEMAESVFIDHGISPRYPLFIEDTEMLVQLAAKNAGIAFAFAYYAEAVQKKREAGNIYLFPFEGPGAGVDVMVSYRKARYMDRITRDFIDLTKEKASLISQNR